MLALTLFSCEKDALQVSEVNPTTTQKLTFSKEELSKLEFLDVSSKEVVPKIENFLSIVQGQTANLRNGNTYSINELIFLLEGSENYLRTSSVVKYQNLTTSETIFPLTYMVVDGNPTFDDGDATQLFAAIDAYIQQEYNAIAGTDKKVAAVNIYPTLDNNNNLALGLSAVMESGGGEEPLDGGCDLLASWKTYTYGTGQGICVGATISTAPNAAERLEEVINDRNGSASCNPRCRGFYTNVYGINMNNPLINPNDNIPNDGYRDYLMFHAHSNQPQYTTCLDPNEMNFYLNGTYSTINWAVNYLQLQQGIPNHNYEFYLGDIQAQTGVSGNGTFNVGHTMLVLIGEYNPDTTPRADCYEED